MMERIYHTQSPRVTPEAEGTIWIEESWRQVGKIRSYPFYGVDSDGTHVLLHGYGNWYWYAIDDPAVAALEPGYDAPDGTHYPREEDR